MKPVGKPDALIGHVRFDERGWETGRRSVRQCSRPSSTLQTGLVLAPAQQLEWLANSRMRGRPMPGSLLATLDLHLHRFRALRFWIKKRRGRSPVLRDGYLFDNGLAVRESERMFRELLEGVQFVAVVPP
jgi:hypothetical protein